MLLQAAAIQAADYYVDHANGRDSNTGRSESQPWKHCPGDPDATGEAGNTRLAPGDTVKFKRGVSYNGTIQLNWSGAPGRPITYDGQSWGSGGRAIITTRNTSIYAFTTLDKPRDWLVFQGLDFYDVGGIADNALLWTFPNPLDPLNILKSVPNGFGLYLQGGGTDILVKDCLFRELGQWIPKKPIADHSQITGYGIALEDNARVQIVRCEFTRMRTGVSIKARKMISDILISDCDFHNYITWCIDVSPRSKGATMRNISIVGTAIHDYHEYDRGNWQGWGEKPHTDGIFFRSAGGLPANWENILVDRCYFYADEKDESVGGSASIYFAEGASGTVRNCVFTGTHHGMGDIAISAPIESQRQVIKILNNTFYGTTRPIYLGKKTSANEVHIINNIMYRPTQSYHHIYCTDLGIIREMDYNLYYGGRTEDSTYLIGGSVNLTLPQMKARGLEKNGFWADPRFVDNSSPLWAASLNDLRLRSDSPAIGRGKNLSSLFTHDFNDHDRLGAWTIGAHANTASSVTRPSRPSNLRIVSW